MKIKKKIQKVSLEKSFSNKKFSLKGYLLILIQLRKKKRKYTLNRILLQNALSFYYKMWQASFFTHRSKNLLQNAAGIRKYVDFVTKRVDYYKMRYKKCY